LSLGPARRPVVCEVSLRARAVVGEPFFEPGPPLTLGRLGCVDAAVGELVAVEVTGPGRGMVAERLGLVTDASAVVHGLAVEAGVAAPWPDDVAAEAARLPEDPGAAGGRVDLRDVPTFTIDPADAGDHDDALSADGERVLVHIADVAAFVPEGGPIDREAARRATSVYLPGRVDPMLPAQLSAGLCSLLPGRDRFALTVEIGPGPLRAYRSVIRSDHSLTYAQAEAMLTSGEGPQELVAALGRLDRIARERAAARAERGGVAVDTAERSFTLEGGAVSSGANRRSGPAHVLVEELMLAANEAVAAELAAAGAAMPYRVHEAPEPAALDVLAERLAALQVPTPPQPPLPTPEQAARFAGLVSQAVARYVRSSGRGRAAFPSIVLRALRKARYDPANLGHAGLASPAYCHYTSPIRRHPDLLVHRALLRHLGALETPAPDAPSVAAAAAHDSAAERAAELLERTADDVCAAFLLERELYERGWDEPFAGEVVGVIDSGAFVRFGGLFEGYLPGRSWAGELVDLDPLGVALVGRRSGRRLRLGDPIEVTVRSVDRVSGRVRIRAVHARQGR
jgi:ribonuclease R